MDKTYNVYGHPQPTMKRIADLGGKDFYPTPAWATHALIGVEEFSGDIWECACGNGAMSTVLEKTGNNVLSSDIYDHGYGDSGIDFIEQNRRVNNIVTNPPYNSASDFIKSGLRQADKKLALLLRLAFLEGVSRANTIYKYTPPTRVWVFSERVTFYPHGHERKGSGTTAYAWFVWDKECKTNSTELKWIQPGYKSLYSGN